MTKKARNLVTAHVHGARPLLRTSDHKRRPKSSPDKGKRHKKATLWLTAAGAFLFLLLVSSLLVLRSNAAVGSPSSSRTSTSPNPTKRRIVVEGLAQLDVQPDSVSVSIVMEADGSSPSAAVATLKTQKATLLVGLRRAGQPSKGISSSHYGLRPQYKRYPAQGISHYVASATTVVSASPPDRLTPVMDAAAASGARWISASFVSKRLPEKKARVRDMALQAARKKAQHIARSLGVRLGAVVSAEEVSSSSGRSYWQSSASVVNAYQAQDRSGPGTAQSLPDVIPLKVRVRVTFSIL